MFVIKGGLIKMSTQTAIAISIRRLV